MNRYLTPDIMVKYRLRVVQARNDDDDDNNNHDDDDMTNVKISPSQCITDVTMGTGKPGFTDAVMYRVRVVNPLGKTCSAVDTRVGSARQSCVKHQHTFSTMPTKPQAPTSGTITIGVYKVYLTLEQMLQKTIRGTKVQCQRQGK